MTEFGLRPYNIWVENCQNSPKRVIMIIIIAGWQNYFYYEKMDINKYKNTVKQANQKSK